MSDPQSPENILARSEQEDPIIMYLIVNETLAMSCGKIAAQCAHASEMLILQYRELLYEFTHIDPSLDRHSYLCKITDLFEEWLMTPLRRIVVLKADKKEWAHLKTDMEEYDVIVVDAGLTQIPAQSQTVIGLWPMRKSLVGKLIKRLQVLK